MSEVIFCTEVIFGQRLFSVKVIFGWRLFLAEVIVGEGSFLRGYFLYNKIRVLFEFDQIYNEFF